MTVLSKTVTLNPGQSQPVGFQVVPTEAGLYQVSVDGLTGGFTAVEKAFDPWQYDTDGDCYIKEAENLEAVRDHFAGKITREQLDQVIALYTGGTRNPACPPEEDELLAKLKSGEIAANWWSYPTPERWEIARYVGRYSASLPIGEYGGKGAKDCGGGPYYEEIRMACHHHLCVRLSKIGKCGTCYSVGPGAGYGNNGYENYWQDKFQRWHCLHNPESFNLPFYWATKVPMWFIPDRPLLPSHAICALQVGTDMTNLNNWLLFQYEDSEIKPLADQKVTANELRVGDLLTITEITMFNGFYNIKKSDIIAGWEITEAGATPYYGPWEK